MNGDHAKGPAEHWTVEEAEDLLCSLDGVISAKLVITPRGHVEEIHVLTTLDVAAKATVRNVESALRAQFDLTIDHRKVSVARTDQRTRVPDRPALEEAIAEVGSAPHAASGVASAPKNQPTQSITPVVQPDTGPPTVPAPQRQETTQRQETRGTQGSLGHGVIESPWAPPTDTPMTSRLIFVRHRQERERSRRLRMTVVLEWAGKNFEGSASSVDVPRGRLEATAEATLGAIGAAVEAAGSTLSLELEGAQIVDALDHSYALVSVHAVVNGRFSPLTGVVAVDTDPEQATILATLRATDRPTRKLLAVRTLADPKAPGTPAPSSPEDPKGDPLKLWGGS